MTLFNFNKFYLSGLVIIPWEMPQEVENIYEIPPS